MNPHYQTEINRIEKVQRTATRWACRRWRNQSHVGEMLEELQWPELQERRQQASLTFFYKIHNNLVTIDKNRYLLRLEVTGVPDPTPFSITFQMHIRTGWNFLSSPGQLQFGMDLQAKLSLQRQLMDLSPKYNDLGLGRDMAWYACPWGMLVNNFNWGGVIKDLYCYLFLLLVFLSTYVPHPHLPSWSDMTECSIERKKERIKICDVKKYF